MSRHWVWIPLASTMDNQKILKPISLLGANKPGFENVANLDQLPAKGIYVLAPSMKIAGVSGGPLRIIAGIQ